MMTFGIASANAKDTLRDSHRDAITPWSGQLSRPPPLAIRSVEDKNRIMPGLFAAFPWRGIGKIRSPGHQQAAPGHTGETTSKPVGIRQGRQFPP